MKPHLLILQECCHLVLKGLLSNMILESLATKPIIYVSQLNIATQSPYMHFCDLAPCCSLAPMRLKVRWFINNKPDECNKTRSSPPNTALSDVVTGASVFFTAFPQPFFPTLALLLSFGTTLCVMVLTMLEDRGSIDKGCMLHSGLLGGYV